MDDETTVTKVTTETHLRTGEFIGECLLVGVGVDDAVFTGKVTDLTGFGQKRVACWLLTTDEGVDVAEGIIAIAITCNWVYV